MTCKFIGLYNATRGTIKVDSDGSHVSVDKWKASHCKTSKDPSCVHCFISPREFFHSYHRPSHQLFCIVIPRSFSAMANLLTPNVLRAIYESESQPVPGIPTPVLQVLAVKKINSTTPNSAERWRVVLSDGAFFIQSMLATQLNPMVANNEIVKGGLIKLGQYTMNKMKDKK